MQKKKIILWTLLSVVILFCIYTIGGSFYLINFALQSSGKDNVGKVTHINDSIYSFMKPWTDSLNNVKAIHDTTIINSQGLRLNGYYIKSTKPTRKTAILIHGYKDCAYSMMPIAYIYSHELQYNVLLPDLQYHGKSDGKAVTMGWKDRKDILLWAKLANTLFGNNTEIVVHGISMGGATTMMVSGEKLPPYIKCFVDDCGYTSVWDEFNYEIKEMFGLPTFPLMYSSSALCKMLYGWSFGEASALNQVAKCKLPMLFIHGSADDYVPTRMVYPLYKAKPQPKEIWIVKGAPHAKSFQLNQKAYIKKVAQFTGKYIK